MKVCPNLPDTIHFNHTEVMRITRDGVWVNPDMQVDETAKAVLDALSSQVKVLVQRAEPVDETAKGGHEPLYMDMSQVPTGMPDWKPGMVFPAPKKEWVGLTDAEIAQTMHGSVEGSNMLPYQFARAIEAKLKEKNVPQP